MRKKVYIYECPVGHHYETDRPLHPQTGCQVMVAVGSWDYTTCGLWCWPKTETSKKDHDAR